MFTAEADKSETRTVRKTVKQIVGDACEDVQDCFGFDEEVEEEEEDEEDDEEDMEAELSTD